MTEAQKIPWNRLAVEAAAIVASILLAFAIDAWWADRELDQWQSAQLGALRDEFSANWEELGAIVRTHDSNARNLESLIAQIQGSDDKTLVTVSDSALAPLVSWRTSDISTGTLDALLSSGWRLLIVPGRFRAARTQKLKQTVVLHFHFRRSS
jgi:hypothetical protein